MLREGKDNWLPVYHSNLWGIFLGRVKSLKSIIQIQNIILKMSSATINKTKDTLNYLAHRAESKISEAGEKIVQGADVYREEVKEIKDMGLTFWDKNGSTLLTGTGIAAIGILLFSKVLK